MFTFEILDTSAITLFDLSTKFENYFVEKTTKRDLVGREWTGLTITWVQSRVINHEQWAVDSLDLVLGLVGGLSGIIWGALSLALGGYEAFKFENSLIGSVYPTSPQDPDDSRAPDEMKAKQAMMRTVAERGKYFYGYSEYLTTGLLNSLAAAVCAEAVLGSSGG